ncbi:nucleoside-diphosphate kinase [Candidatus Pacearchaeota archaeon]|nr:nucleoside-diphosphate kinase [Candidatus Pacearchaeota archaeon]
MTEKTLVLIKPDGVKKGIIGKILTRFEDTGLKIIAMKMIQADKKLAQNHYQLDEEWAKKLYERAKKTYEEQKKKLEYKDHMHMGKTIQERNMTFLTEGPVIALVLEAPHAIELIRKMIGHTEPRQALPGTIRGDFASTESYSISDSKSRSIRNLIHASDSVENASREISLWFSPKELYPNYKILHDFLIE